MAVLAGQMIGPYEITAQIGAGGMGEVYRARDPRLGRDVAIKVLPGSFSADPDRLQRFAQEARAAATLNHPNILDCRSAADWRQRTIKESFIPILSPRSCSSPPMAKAEVENFSGREHAERLQVSLGLTG